MLPTRRVSAHVHSDVNSVCMCMYMVECSLLVVCAAIVSTFRVDLLAGLMGDIVLRRGIDRREVDSSRVTTEILRKTFRVGDHPSFLV